MFKSKSYIDGAQLTISRNVDTLEVIPGKVLAVKITTQEWVTDIEVTSIDDNTKWLKNNEKIVEVLVWKKDFKKYLETGEYDKNLMMVGPNFHEKIIKMGYVRAAEEEYLEYKTNPDQRIPWEFPYSECEQCGDNEKTRNRIILSGHYDHIPKTIEGKPLRCGVIFDSYHDMGRITPQTIDIDQLINEIKNRKDLMFINFTGDNVTNESTRYPYKNLSFVWQPSIEQWNKLTENVKIFKSKYVFHKFIFDNDLVKLREFYIISDLDEEIEEDEEY